MNVKRSNNIDVKKINRANTLRCILENGQVSQPELAKRLALSWPTVLQNVKELVALGLVRECGMLDSTGGRKARAFESVPNARIALGVQIAVDHIALAIVDLAGNLLSSERVEKEFEDTNAYSRMLGDVIARFIDSCGHPREKVLGVGIALPGVLDASGDLITGAYALKVRSLSARRLSQNIALPYVFMNDTAAAALTDMHGGATTQNAVYISLSGTVDGAIVTKGELYQGDRLRAGGFGHVTLVPDGRMCSCGKRGCAEVYLNAKQLAARTDGDLRRFFDGVRAGKPKYNAQWNEYLDMLAVEVNNLHMVFDCDVVLGGIVGVYLEKYENELRERLIEKDPFDSDVSYFRMSKFHSESTAVGAALRLINRFLESVEA